MQNKDLVQKLLDNGAQFGHKTSKFNPEMTPYVWGVRNGMHLIDINKTAFLIDHACKQVETITANGGQILWVGTKRQIQKVVQSAATKVKQPYVVHRWIGGTLTNSDQVRKAITKLLHMRDVVEKPLAHMKKKQVSMIKKDLDRLEKNVSGIVSLRTPPAALIVVDVKREITAVKEARSCNVPVIAVVDTNSSTHGVNTVIPANDDSSKSIGLIIELLADAAAKGLTAFYEKHPERQKKDEAAFEKRSLPELKEKKQTSSVRSESNNDASRLSRPAAGGPRRTNSSGSATNSRPSYGDRDRSSAGSKRSEFNPRNRNNSRSATPRTSSTMPATRPMKNTSQVVGDNVVASKDAENNK